MGLNFIKRRKTLRLDQLRTTVLTVANCANQWESLPVFATVKKAK